VTFCCSLRCGDVWAGCIVAASASAARGDLVRLERLGKMSEERERGLGSGGGARSATVDCGDGLSPGELGSSIRASLLSPAESLFPGEVGSAEKARPGLTNNKKASQLGWGENL
jgi:hypothetical protein